MKSNHLETIKILDGEIFHIEYHQQRYERVLNSLGVNPSKKLLDFIKPPEWGLYRCRLVYNADTIEVTYHEYKKREINSFKLIFDNEIEYSHKAENREDIDRLFYLREDADEILIIKNLMITDTSIANIAFYRDGIWYTPKNPLLEGTTRERLLESGKIVQSDIKASDLRTFSKIALLNAMIDFDIIDEYEFLL